MTPEPILPLYIDSTMLSCFRSCPQKFRNEFLLGLRKPQTSIHLHAGGAFSGTLERFYKEIWENNCDIPTALGRANSTFRSLWGDFTPLSDKSAKTDTNTWAAVEDYVRTYPPKSDHVQPYFVDGKPTFEFSFAIPLDFPGFPSHPSGAPFLYVGRADLLGEYNGRPVIRDEKTAGQLEGFWADKWNLRGQFMGYCWAAQKSGIDCNTVIVRGVIITKKEIRQVEAIKIYTEQDISRWFYQLQRDLIRLRQCFDDDYWDYNLGETCTAYGLCPYMDICKSPTPENWYSNYEVRRWNPLDRNPVDPTQTGDRSPPSPAANPASFGSPSLDSLASALKASIEEPTPTPGTAVSHSQD